MDEDLKALLLGLLILTSPLLLIILGGLVVEIIGALK